MPMAARTDRQIVRARQAKRQRREPDVRPSAALRGYDRRWQAFARWWLSSNPLCVVCGELAKIADHITPLSEGGAHCDPENTQSLCQTCHNRKTKRDLRQNRVGGKKGFGAAL